MGERREKYLMSSHRWIWDAPFFDNSYEKRRLRIAIAEIAPGDFEEWAIWALAQAERIDPVVSGALARSIISKGPSLEEIPIEEI